MDPTYAVKSPAQLQKITSTLAELYPGARYELNFSTPLELLVATILAAQCTDERVNAVTRGGPSMTTSSKRSLASAMILRIRPVDSRSAGLGGTGPLGSSHRLACWVSTT